jgi:hypothetical protein
MIPDGNLVEEVYRLVYHGGVLDFEHARPVELRSGGHVSGVDINVGAGRKTPRHIRGVLINSATGQPAGGVPVRALLLEPTISNMTPIATTAPNGAFDIVGVFPGSYAVFTPYINNAATAPVAGTVNSTIAYVRLEIGDTDVDDLRLVAVRPTKSTGRVIIEGRQPQETVSDLSKIRVSLVQGRLGMPGVVPPGGGPGNGIVNGNGAFTLWTSPVEFGLGVGGVPANTYIKSIRFGERDVLKVGAFRATDNASDSIEIVIGTDAGEISGTVVSGAGPMGNAIVVLVPELPQSRTEFRPDASTTTATTDSAGRFRLQTVPPGAYKIFAWEYIEQFLWFDPEVLQTYEASGKLVYVTEGTKQEVQVTVLPKPR